MNTNEIIDLYRSNDWVHNLLLRAATSLSAEEVIGTSAAATRASATSSLTSSPQNGLGSNAGKASVLNRSPIGSPKISPSLPGYLQDVQARRDLFLQSLSDAALSSEIAFRFLSGAADHHPFHDLLIHVADHSTYHRGQLASKLRQAGAVPPPTGFIAFKAEQRGKT
jgi:uncharacterized damage-inducible protein DinB